MFRVPVTEHDVNIHVVHVPRSARHDGVCLRWTSVAVSVSFSGCWALDDVLVNRIVGLADQLHDDFDPVDISNWLFYPGGRIEVCADSNAITLCSYYLPRNRTVVMNCTRAIMTYNLYFTRGPSSG